jgi:negative regulator of replication initiation
MKPIAVTDDVYEQVELLARAWGVSKSDTLRRLLDNFRDSNTSLADSSPETTAVPVHVIYAGVRTDGLYDPVTQSLTITTGQLAGRVFSKPSGAAVALVQALSPGVNPNRNGWSFWILSKTGERLQSIRNSSTSKE